MKSVRKKIAAILASIVVLPVLVLTVYEVMSLNQNEVAIEEIYKNQLDAIIYSVNQYSEDVVSNWANRMDTYLLFYENEPKRFEEEMTRFLNENQSVISIECADSLLTSFITFEFDNGELQVDSSNESASFSSSKVKEKLGWLYTYQRGGYKKIAPIENEAVSDPTNLLFTLTAPVKNYSLCIIRINPLRFIEQILMPKVQSISQEEIIISFLNPDKDELIYSNLHQRLGEDKFVRDGKLWLIPNVYVAIALKDRTIEGLVAERSITSLFLIVLLTLFLIGAVIMLYRSVNREVKLAQLKSDFVSNVSHELRTPLALISMFAETLEMNRAKSEEKKQQYYKIISQETTRLSRIVNTILNFSKMEAGKREYKKEPIDLNSVVTKVLDTYNFHLHNKGFEYKFDKHNSELIINADKEAVSEGLINLIDNAMKYSGETKQVDIKTSSDSAHAVVEVTDYGIGISDEDQKKIFDKFYRVSSGLVHNTKGTGMGLSIVKHIVDANGGEVKVKSKVEKGSTFILQFPLANKN